MMSLLFCNSSHAIHEFECLLEIREAKLALQMMLIHDRPRRNALMQFFQSRALQRGDAYPTRNALFISEMFAHVNLQDD